MTTSFVFVKYERSALQRDDSGRMIIHFALNDWKGTQGK